MDIVTQGPTLRLVGDLDARSTGEVRSALYDHLAGSRDVVVDLTGVDTADLAGLRVLAVASHHAHRHGQHLILRGCRPAVRRLLLLSGLRRVVEVEGTQISA